MYNSVMVIKKLGFYLVLVGFLYCHVFGENSPFSLEDERYWARGFVSIWTLKDGDLLPSPITVDNPLSFSIKKPQIPGHVEIESSTFSISNPIELKFKMNFFYMCEKTDLHCSKAYLSAQIKISGQASGFCGAYFSKEDFFPFPVMFCSVYYGDGLAGITLHRKSYLETGRF